MRGWTLDQGIESLIRALDLSEELGLRGNGEPLTIRIYQRIAKGRVEIAAYSVIDLVAQGHGTTFAGLPPGRSGSGSGAGSRVKMPATAKRETVPG